MKTHVKTVLYNASLQHGKEQIQSHRYKFSTTCFKELSQSQVQTWACKIFTINSIATCKPHHPVIPHSL